VTSLAELLPAPGAGTENAPLVYAGDAVTSRAELHADVVRVSAAITGHDPTPGDRIGVMLGNDARTVATLFGVWNAADVYVPVNPRLPDAELERLLAATDPHLVITTSSGTDRFAGVAFEPIAGTELRIGARALDTAREEADVALLQTTSGTTGRPRPVPLRHTAVMTLLDAVVGSIGARGEGRAPMPNLIPVSLSLWAGIYNVCFAFRVGAPVVLMERFDARELARLIAQHSVRSVVLPPAAMAMCCDDPALEDLEPLRYVRSITAPLSPFLARRFHDRFGVAVLNCYGQTELGGEVVGWNASDWREFGKSKLGAVGRPHAGVELRVDEHDEIWVRTPATRASAALLGDRVDEEGWLRTGDCGRVDADGFLWIDGRVSDMVNRGGLKVFPDEVEEVLRTVEGVDDVAVVGEEDARLGEVPVAYVVGDADPIALERRAREHLAPYKVPVRFDVVDELPRNEVGKLLRRELTQRRDG
jgi:long-chain acyl-CoA synthetase